MKRTSIRKKFLLGIIVFAIVLILGLSLLVAQRQFIIAKNNASEKAFSYARLAAKLIDGDRISGYLETGKKDQYYQQILHCLNEAQLQAGLKYYYVFVPFEKDLVYIWDAQNLEGACDLGDREDYMQGGKEAVEKIYKKASKKATPENFKITNTKKYKLIGSAFSPVYNSAGDPVAVVGVDLDFHSFYHNLFRALLLLVLLVGVVALTAIAVFYLMLERNLLRPIHRLTKSAGQIVNNLDRDEALDIDIKTGDELETLADALCTMDRDLREYISELGKMTAEKERINAELDVANNIQSSMLPRIFPPFPERDDFEIYATMDPAKQVGGDFYDFFLIDDDHLGLVMADVSDKGIPAALFMVVTKTLIKNNATVGVRPAEVIRRVNELLCKDNDASMFVTVWFGIIELSSGRGLAANAGHEHPVVRRSGGNYELVVYKHSPAVAIMDGIEFRDHEFTMEPGDSLFVYTDGVAEATNSNDELFGTDRLLDALNSEPDAGPKEVLENVRNAIDVFVGDAPQFDDITMLSLKYNGGKKS